MSCTGINLFHFISCHFILPYKAHNFEPQLTFILLAAVFLFAVNASFHISAPLARPQRTTLHDRSLHTQAEA